MSASFENRTPAQDAGTQNTVSRSITTSAFASATLGEYAYAEPHGLSTQVLVYNHSLRYTTAAGFYAFGRRAYGRPERYTLPTTSVQVDPVPEIRVTSATNAFLGSLRTDVQYPIISKIRFTNDLKGCSDFELELLELPDFPILPFSEISFRIGLAAEDTFRGRIEAKPRRGSSPNEPYVFRGYGLRKQLDRIRIEEGAETYPGGTDVADIVSDLLDTYIVPETTIRRNNSKLVASTGIVLISAITFGKQPLVQALDWIAKFTGFQFRWRVDGAGDFVFTTRSQTPIRQIFCGVDIESGDPEENWDTIFNSILVKRQPSKGSGGSGWILAARENDATSIAKYGLRELEVQVPGTLSDADSVLVANRLLTEYSEPTFAARVQNWPVESADDILESGYYQVISDSDTYTQIVQECDDDTDWTKTGGGDSILTTDSSIFATGAGALKLAYSAAFTDTYTASVASKPGKVLRVSFYIQSNNSDAIIRIGVGDGSWTQYQQDVTFPVTSQFRRVEFDVSAGSLEDVTQVGFQVRDSATGAATRNVWIDEISVLRAGAEWYTMELSKATYTLEPAGNTANLEFETVRPQFYDRISALIEDSREIKGTIEVR